MTNKQQQIIEVLPYDPQWPKLFQQEAALLKTIFASIVRDIYHIGSTSIPNMHAKPVIDIMMIVSDINAVDQYNSAMQAAGYEAWGEYHIPGRRFFLKGDEKRTHHVHAFEVGSEHVSRHLIFRDYLMAHPDIAQAYVDLKLQLAEQYRHIRRAYAEQKADYVKQLEQQALQWYAAKSKRKL